MAGLAIFVGGVVLIFMLIVTRVRTESRWIDPETGSQMHQTQWFGSQTSMVVTPSAVQARLTRMGIARRENWELYTETEHNIFGSVISRGCSYRRIAQFPPSLMQQFVDASSDDQIKQFVSTMHSGTEELHQAAIDAAADCALGSQ